MSFASIEEVQSHLPELLDKMSAGDELVITRDGKPVATLTTARAIVAGNESLHGSVLQYDRPTEPVAEADWGVL